MSANTVGILVPSGFEIVAGKSTTHVSTAMSVRIAASPSRKSGATTDDEPAQETGARRA